ncbi:MAG: UvrD-helicase domain-containing protein [Vicinamibacterales bacterium]
MNPGSDSRRSTSGGEALPDAAAREAIATLFDDTLVVEAAAGTGKTTELVNRIVRIVATGRAKVDAIVAVTFTEKAAGELKLRLREALDAERTAAATEGERDALNEALRKLEEAHVNTIHGFCAELLRERPVEARVDPLFVVLTETQAERLFEQAFGAWIQQELHDPRPGVRRGLRRSVWQGRGGMREDTAVDRLRRAAWELAGWRDFAAPWTRRPFDRDASADRVIETLGDFAGLSEHPSYARDSLFTDTAAARDLSAEIVLQRDAAQASAERQDYDGWEARLVDLSRDRNFSKARRGRGPGYKQGVSRQRVIDAYEALRIALDQFRLDADADLAAALQQELGGAVERYEELKAHSGALDFLDLLLKARDLVRRHAGVRRGFQRRFTHLFVDEFQDTDPLQAEILLLLASSDPDETDWRRVVPVPGRLFIVGDPKQSIYRFRRADVGIYREVCERLISSGARPVFLTTSFRSVPDIQDVVNAAFEPVMTGNAATLQAQYVPLSRHRRAMLNQPSVVALPVPEPYGVKNVSAVKIEASLPDAVGAFVDWIVNESGWKVSAADGGSPGPDLSAVRSRDICMLFRRFLSFGEDVTQPYVRALEARGIPHVLVGGKTFHDREEVETLRAALSAIEWPDDELAVFAALRGALFAIGDEELFEWKQRFRVFHPFRIPAETDQGSDAEHLRPIADALRVLQQLHRRRNYRPVADTVQDLLHATRAYVGIVLRSAGEQALANVLHISELARAYETAGGLSFRGFVDELRAAAESAQADEAPILEEGSDGVRIMTVHKAKGLEFPIVILADPTCKLSRVDAGRWLDPAQNLCALKLGGWAPIDLLLHDPEEAARERAEGERLAYVAATRARDVLVVPAIGDGAYDGGWLDPLLPAIYPAEARRRAPDRAAGCPTFASKDTVLTRPNGDPAGPHTVAPGSFSIHQSTNSPTHQLHYSVTWWDPRALHLGASSPLGLRRDDLIVKTGDMFSVQERMDDYERWRADRTDTIARASRESIRVQTATAWAAQAAQDGLDQALLDLSLIEVIEIAGAADRPRGPRFGSLVHAILAAVPLDANEGVAGSLAEMHARILGATPDEIASATLVVEAVLKHDLMARARRSPAVRRETPVSWVQEDGMLIEGVLDLAFEEDGILVVVDFKTDHELSAGESRYRLQLQQYVGAVSRATGRPASGVLFRV